MNQATNTPPEQESYIVSEGKKRGSTRDVRPEAVYDRYYTVLRVHGGDAILTDNWHTNEVLTHTKANFEGYTFAMRTPWRSSNCFISASGSNQCSSPGSGTGMA